jgi:dodecin
LRDDAHRQRLVGRRRRTRRAPAATPDDEGVMLADSVYRVTELIGTSSESWEAAARSAISTASESLRDLRVAEVTKNDLVLENGQVSSYRVRLEVSFKYETGR